LRSPAASLPAAPSFLLAHLLGPGVGSIAAAASFTYSFASAIVAVVAAPCVGQPPFASAFANAAIVLSSDFWRQSGSTGAPVFAAFAQHFSLAPMSLPM